MRYYKFNIGDYASHTRHLSLMEDLAYRRLLDLAYSSELPLSKDIHALSRVLGMRDYQSEIHDVLNEFFIEVEEGWIHNRVLKEIEESGGRSAKAQTAAKARWECKRNANAMLGQCLNDATSINKNSSSMKNDATHYPLPITHNPLPIEKPKLRKRSSAISIQEFFSQCEAKNEKRIPDSDPVFDYAEQIGITLEMVKVCWQEFVRTHSENGKKQSDWRATFRNYVRKNYYRLWYVEADGSVKETPQYRALKKVTEVNHAQH